METPKENNTITIQPTGNFNTVFARITAEGEVFIDWDAAEKVARDGSAGRAIAQLIIAVRDGKEKLL